MRHFRVKVSLFLLVAFLGICLIGCTGPLPKMEDIKGKWMAIEREPGIPGRSGQVGFVIEFSSDNTVELPSGKGTWAILADGRVKIDMTGLIMHGELEKGLLTITNPNDQTKVIFKKMS